MKDEEEPQKVEVEEATKVEVEEAEVSKAEKRNTKLQAKLQSAMSDPIMIT